MADSEEKLSKVVSEFNMRKKNLREEVDFLSTWGRKWQLMEGVEEMWYTE